MTPTQNIAIAGVGGQGIVLASRLIGLTAIGNGFHVTCSETHGAAQRGGSVVSHVRIGQEKPGPLIPRGEADVLLGFEPIETLRVASDLASPDLVIVANSRAMYPLGVATGWDATKIEGQLKRLSKKLWSLNAVDLAAKTGSLITLNVVMVGALAGSDSTPFASSEYRNAIANHVKRFKQQNLRAFDLGVDAMRSIIS